VLKSDEARRFDSRPRTLAVSGYALRIFRILVSTSRHSPLHRAKHAECATTRTWERGYLGDEARAWASAQMLMGITSAMAAAFIVTSSAERIPMTTLSTMLGRAAKVNTTTLIEQHAFVASAAHPSTFACTLDDT
jgi:hypothetical protein